MNIEEAIAYQQEMKTEFFSYELNGTVFRKRCEDMTELDWKIAEALINEDCEKWVKQEQGVA